MTSSSPIRLLLVDDHRVLLQALAFLINREPGLTVVGQATTGAAAIQQARLLQPDVILLDLQLPDMDGIVIIQQILEQQPAVRILLLTANYGDEWVRRAVAAGARGYLLKETDTAAIVRAIYASVHDEALILPALAGAALSKPSPISSMSIPVPPGGALTVREREVVRLILAGQSNKEIGRTLGLSENTVKHHVTALLQKLELADRTQLVIYVSQHHLIP